MAEFFIDVGKIKLTWKGNWDSSTAYVVDDLVWYDDGSTVSSYICVADHTNQIPSVTGTVDLNYWNLFAGGGLAGGLQPGGTASNQIQYRSGLALAAESGFEYDPATDVLSVPAISVTGSAAGAPTHDIDVAGSIHANGFYDGANQLTYNISGAQITSGTVDNARLPSSINVASISSTSDFAVKTSGIFFDSATDRVGIGTNLPAARLDVRSIALATEDDVVARFRSDHTNAFGTFIEVMPNTSQAQKSGIHLHKNSLRSDPVSIYNDGGALTISNADQTSPSVNFVLNGTSEMSLTSDILVLNNPFRINGCFDEAALSISISTNTVTLDTRLASVFVFTRNDIVSTTNVILPSGARAVSLTLVMTTNGNYSFTWPSNTKWPNGQAPSLSTTAGLVDVVTLSTTNGGTTWYGFVGGSGFQ